MLSFFTIQDRLLEKNILLFTPHDMARLFQLSNVQAKYYLRTWTKNGQLLRLKRGFYAEARHLPSEEEIANRLYQPSYLSFEYAMSRYGIMPEAVYAVTSATPMPTRTFSVREKTFFYGTIKKQAFTGYTAEKLHDRAILIAEPEKALVDYLYFVVLGKKPWNDRLRVRDLDRKKIMRYAGLYERPSLLKFISKKFP